MAVLTANNAESTLAAAITSTTQTSISIVSGDNFPANFQTVANGGTGDIMYITVASGSDSEVIEVTDWVGDSVPAVATVVRSTATDVAKTFPTNSQVQLRVTAELFQRQVEGITSDSLNNITVEDNLTVDGTTFTVNNNVVLGSSNADTITINGTIGNISAGELTGTKLTVDDLVIDSNDITATGTADDIDIDIVPKGTGEVNISKADINSGNIDNTVIGTDTPAAGTFVATTSEGNFTVKNGNGGADVFTVDSATGNTVIAGNLDVNGTTTTIDTTNLSVADKNILVATLDDPLLRNNSAYTGAGVTVDALTSSTTLVTAGAFAIGTSYTIVTVGTTNFTAIGASANTVGITFTATGAGSGTGTAGVTTASPSILWNTTNEQWDFSDSITASNIGTIAALSTIDTANITNDAVTADKLADSTDTDANRAVTTDHLRDSAVTTAKITDLNVTTGKIANDAIDVSKLSATTDATPANDAGKVLTLDAEGDDLIWTTPTSVSGLPSPPNVADDVTTRYTLQVTDTSGTEVATWQETTAVAPQLVADKPSSPAFGDEWTDADNGKSYRYVDSSVTGADSWIQIGGIGQSTVNNFNDPYVNSLTRNGTTGVVTVAGGNSFTSTTFDTFTNAKARDAVNISDSGNVLTYTDNNDTEQTFTPTGTFTPALARDALAISDTGGVLTYTDNNDTVQTFTPAGAANLGKTESATNIIITSSTGDDVTIDAADGTNAGVMTKADFDKLGGIATSANNYTHPTHTTRTVAVANTALTGANVFSDIDIALTSDAEGHVTAASAATASRAMTLADLGYTGVTDATNNTGTVTSIATNDGLDGGTITNTGTIGITAGGVNLDRMSATGTRDSSTFLRGDNTWAEPGGGSTPNSNSVSPPSGTKGFIAFISGGGGAGAGAINNNTYSNTGPGGNGGAGGFSIMCREYTGGTISVSEGGAGGAGNAQQDGGAGGTSSVTYSGSTVSATGGGGGRTINSGTTPRNGSHGTGNAGEGAGSSGGSRGTGNGGGTARNGGAGGVEIAFFT